MPSGSASVSTTTGSSAMAKSKNRPAALVTGGSRGIGREIAPQLAARGGRVGAHYPRNKAAAESVLAEMPGRGHVAFRADMADGAAVARLWGEATGRLGALGSVVNNATEHGDPPPLSIAEE